MDLFEFTDYKTFVGEWVPTRPKGELMRVAKALNIHSSLLSKVFKGNKHLSLEQAFSFGEYIGFSELENDYFITLVQKARSGTYQLKEHFEKQAKKLKYQSLEISEKFKKKKQLGDSETAIFYSNWHYSVVYLLSSIPTINTPEQIADLLKLKLSQVKEILQFLIQTELCIQEDNTLSMGPQQIHIDASSPWLSRHHLNWRLKTHEKIDNLTASETIFTAPLSLSVADSFKVKEMITKLISESISVATDSPAEKISCLNIDWFDVITVEK